MNDFVRLSKSLMRCNDSSAESLRRFGRPFSSVDFAFCLATVFLPLRFCPDSGHDTMLHSHEKRVPWAESLPRMGDDLAASGGDEWGELWPT